jgi:hypothetical protein
MSPTSMSASLRTSSEIETFEIRLGVRRSVRGSRPERAGRHALVRLQAIAIGHAELARELALLAHGIRRGQMRTASIHADNARAHERQDARRFVT